jgi:predicted transcriptional regulator
MPRTAFSIRLPADLAEVFDRIAMHRGSSRSDSVETLIQAIDAEDREAIVNTTVVGAPTEKCNLRLNPETIERLKQLAGDVEVSDFLRRILSYIVAMAPSDWLAHEPDSSPSSKQRRSLRSRHRRTVDPGEDLSAVQAAVPLGSVVAVAVTVLAAVMFLIVWFVNRMSAGPSSPPDAKSRGQLTEGTTEQPTA